VDRRGIVGGTAYVGGVGAATGRSRHAIHRTNIAPYPVCATRAARATEAEQRHRRIAIAARADCPSHRDAHARSARPGSRRNHRPHPARIPCAAHALAGLTAAADAHPLPRGRTDRRRTGPNASPRRARPTLRRERSHARTWISGGDWPLARSMAAPGPFSPRTSLPWRGSVGEARGRRGWLPQPQRIHRGIPTHTRHEPGSLLRPALAGQTFPGFCGGGAKVMNRQHRTVRSPEDALGDAPQGRTPGPTNPSDVGRSSVSNFQVHSS
jgi:hypothetical protein